MEKIKKHWKTIVIVLLVLFGCSKCTKSCSVQTRYNNYVEVTDSINTVKDNQIRMLEDSCRILNTELLIYKERVRGMQSALSIQEEAAKRVAEAKKNISVTVKQESDGDKMN